MLKFLIHTAVYACVAFVLMLGCNAWLLPLLELNTLPQISTLVFTGLFYLIIVLFRGKHFFT